MIAILAVMVKNVEPVTPRPGQGKMIVASNNLPGRESTSSTIKPSSPYGTSISRFNANAVIPDLSTTRTCNLVAYPATRPRTCTVGVMAISVKTAIKPPAGKRSSLNTRRPSFHYATSTKKWPVTNVMPAQKTAKSCLQTVTAVTTWTMHTVASKGKLVTIVIISAAGASMSDLSMT